jgi:hypothetical protein
MDCKHESFEDGGSVGNMEQDWRPRQRSASTLSEQLLEEYAKTEESNETFKKKYQEAYKNVFGSKSPVHSDYSTLCLNDKVTVTLQSDLQSVPEIRFFL